MTTKRILIVDDEYLACVSLADFLREAGYEAVAVGDGGSAIDLQRQQPFDVCIVDIRMPGLDGVETIVALHRVASNSRFIVYTGSPQFALSVALKRLGLSECDVIRKPVLDMNAFLTLIEPPDEPPRADIEKRG